MEVYTPKDCIVLSYTDQLKPYSVKRSKDDEVFSVGDHVGSGGPVKGYIKEFRVSHSGLFVITDWSGVGLMLNDIYKVDKLPSRFQVNDLVKIAFPHFMITQAKVIMVHFTDRKVFYDLEVGFFKDVRQPDPKCAGEPTAVTRIYKVISDIVEPFYDTQK